MKDTTTRSELDTPFAVGVNSVVRCPDCHHYPCACPLIEQARKSLKREADAIQEALLYRELWEAAASCLLYNRGKIKPRGEDERRLLDVAEKSMCGHYWSGATDGWMPEAGQMDLFGT
jgi:hypothetical protein